MRIIAGSARGRRLLSVPQSMSVRPISDRIKQSLFDILRPRLPGSCFLDLFAGTGAVGMEALSRGAESVVFVDNDARCVKVIERNLERVQWNARGKVFRGNVMGPLGWIAYRGGVERFDIIFMGPPYKDEQKRPLQYTHAVVSAIVPAGLLAPNGWIVAQHHQKEEVVVPQGLERFRQSKYGDTLVSFFRLSGTVRSELSSQ